MPGFPESFPVLLQQNIIMIWMIKRSREKRGRDCGLPEHSLGAPEAEWEPSELAWVSRALWAVQIFLSSVLVPWPHPGRKCGKVPYCRYLFKQQQWKKTIKHDRSLQGIVPIKTNKVVPEPDLVLWDTEKTFNLKNLSPSSRGEEWAYLPQKSKRALECLAGLWGKGAFSWS